MEGSGASPAAVVEALGRDKKARDGRVPFVLAPEIGKYRLVFYPSQHGAGGTGGDG